MLVQMWRGHGITWTFILAGCIGPRLGGMVKGSLWRRIESHLAYAKPLNEQDRMGAHSEL